jgi:hypothetical protein
MANGDPLRAEQIFGEISGEWFARWAKWREYRGERFSKP